ncbi:MAG: sterol desaturase family protein, partial [Spongiibacteraceae bacterium]
MITKKLDQLLNAEIPDISIPKQWNIVERMLLIGYNLLYSALLFLSYPSSFIGFGLGDDFSPSFILSFFETLKQQHTGLFYGSLALVTFHYLFRIQIMIRGQLHYKTNDPRLPTKTLLLYLIANSLNLFFVMSTCLLSALVLWALGGDFASGLQWLTKTFWYTVELANRVPTIIELPYFLAFVVVFLFHGLLHYWVHRLCHMNRFLWLALHRFHHMPETLTNASTT